MNNEINKSMRLSQKYLKLTGIIPALLVFALVHFNTVQAQTTVPNLITYQALIKDANGNALGSGTPLNQTVFFRVYNHPTSTAAVNLLYSEEQVVTIFEGQVNTLIGQGIAVENPPGSGTFEPKPALSSVFNGNTWSTTIILPYLTTTIIP